MTTTELEPKTVFGFAGFSPDDMVDEPTLAGSLRVTPRTVRRMVVRGELPAPILLAGRRAWNIGRVRLWIDRLSEAAEAKVTEQRLQEEAERRRLDEKNELL